MEMTTVKKQSINILIVDDHRMVREGIRIMLETYGDRKNYFIDEAENGEEAMEAMKKEKFDVILLDYQMPGMTGAETLMKIMENDKEAKVIAVSNYEEYAYIAEMLQLGAKGYVLKNISPSELQLAIETVMKGKNYYSNDVALKLINVDNIQNNQVLVEKRDGISKREMEILKLIAMEKTNEQIADDLNIAKRTVDSHRQNLLNKLSVKNTAGLINYAHKNKLI